MQIKCFTNYTATFCSFYSRTILHRISFTFLTPYMLLINYSTSFYKSTVVTAYLKYSGACLDVTLSCHYQWVSATGWIKYKWVYQVFSKVKVSNILTILQLTVIFQCLAASEISDASDCRIGPLRNFLVIYKPEKYLHT